MSHLIGLGGFLVLLHGGRHLLQPSLDGHQYFRKSLRGTPRYVRLRSCERLYISLTLLLGAVQAIEGRPKLVPSPERILKRWKAIQEGAEGRGGGITSATKGIYWLNFMPSIIRIIKLTASTGSSSHVLAVEEAALLP